MDKINLKAVLLQNMGEDSADFLPIMGDEKELLNDNMQIPDTLPILPLRNTVLFPGVIIPINIGRDKSLKLIKDSYRQSALIGVVAQKDTNTENPDINDLYQIGTVASILKILEMPDGTTLALTATERTLLRKLAENRGHIVTYDALCEAVWGADYYGYENSLGVHIRHLREKLEPEPGRPRFLQTVRGIGYKLAKEDAR